MGDRGRFSFDNTERVDLSWESTANFRLQFRADIAQGTWADEPTPPVVEGNHRTVRLPLTGPGRFFRLINP